METRIVTEGQIRFDHALCTSTGNTAKDGIGWSIVVPDQVGRRKRVQQYRSRGSPMAPNARPTLSEAKQLAAANGLALVRVTIGAMFVWVFFENLGKGLYTSAGYANLINYYIKASHSPAAWKAVMAMAASHAAMAAPMQAMTEISLGILLVVGLL